MVDGGEHDYCRAQGVRPRGRSMPTPELTGLSLATRRGSSLGGRKHFCLGSCGRAKPEGRELVKRAA